MEKIKLAIFASGSGSNAKNIIQYFKAHFSIEIDCVLSNKSDAPIIYWCNQNNVETIVLDNQKVEDGNFLNSICQERAINFIILAGYLRKIPSELIHAFEKVTGRKLSYELGPRRPGDVEAVYADCTKARSILNWECTYSIEQMMETAWRWEEQLAVWRSAGII